MPKKKAARLVVRPLTTERWSDFERLFGERGGYSGCWCMWWRSTRSEFEKNQGDGNRRAMKRIVREGPPPGILAYEGDEPVAWCSIAPRETYPSLARSPVLRPIDDKPVWSIVCFFVAKDHRGRGLSIDVIRGAVEYARSEGATTIEAYPTDPRGRKLAPVSSYMGLPALFEAAGFREVARPSAARVIMRMKLGRAKRSGR